MNGNFIGNLIASTSVAASFAGLIAIIAMIGMVFRLVLARPNTIAAFATRRQGWVGL